VNLKGVVTDDDAGPHALHDLVLGDEVASRPDEESEDVEGALADGTGDTVHQELAAFEVNFHAPRLVHQPLTLAGQWQTPV
jgi:hypothetical protein